MENRKKMTEKTKEGEGGECVRESERVWGGDYIYNVISPVNRGENVPIYNVVINYVVMVPLIISRRPLQRVPCVCE